LGYDVLDYEVDVLDPVVFGIVSVFSRIVARNTHFIPHSPDNVLSFGVTLRDSDIAISSLF
jgi:hypothetical protein